MIADYFRHLIRAGNRHSLHSPFLYEFYESVIRSKTLPFDASDIDILFRLLKNDKRMIKVTDMGAGSKFGNKSEKQISSIARTAVKSGKWVGILARIIARFDYRYVVELGTSLGFTTSYLSKATPYGKVYTFEGCPETLKIAKENFEKLECRNIVPMLGNIDGTLHNTLEQLERLDFVFFDANHQYEATMRYFRACMEKGHEESCFVFDDIYWSEGMKKAWQEIKAHPKVTLSLDFFQIGIIFFRTNQPKQEFVLRA